MPIAVSSATIGIEYFQNRYSEFGASRDIPQVGEKKALLYTWFRLGLGASSASKGNTTIYQ